MGLSNRENAYGFICKHRRLATLHPEVWGHSPTQLRSVPHCAGSMFECCRRPTASRLRLDVAPAPCVTAQAAPRQGACAVIAIRPSPVARTGRLAHPRMPRLGIPQLQGANGRCRAPGKTTSIKKRYLSVKVPRNKKLPQKYGIKSKGDH